MQLFYLEVTNILLAIFLRLLLASSKLLKQLIACLMYINNIQQHHFIAYWSPFVGSDARRVSCLLALNELDASFKFCFMLLASWVFTGNVFNQGDWTTMNSKKERKWKEKEIMQLSSLLSSIFQVHHATQQKNE